MTDAKGVAWEAARGRLMALVNQQSMDQALWLTPASPREAYLLKELRRLHAVVEDVCGEQTGPGGVCPRCHGARRWVTRSGMSLECPTCEGHGVILT